MENSELPEKINKLREGCDRLRRRSGERLSATGLMVQLVMLETTPRKDTRERILEVAVSAVLAFAATLIGKLAQLLAMRAYGLAVVEKICPARKLWKFGSRPTGCVMPSGKGLLSVR